MLLVGRPVVAALMLVLGIVATAENGWAQTASRLREAAVLKARSGQMEEAQADLRRMLASGIDDGLVAMDLATLLQQDGKPEEALAVFTTAAAASPPGYALLAAARAGRDLRRYEEAARLAREGSRRFPTETVWPLLLSLILSDAGRADEALEILRQPAVSRAPPVERLLAEAYAWRRKGDAYKALSLYADAVQLAPANQEARAEMATILRQMGAPRAAAEVTTRTPPIAADEAAAMVRWGAEVRPSDPAGRFDGTDAALARLDSLLADLPPPPEAMELRRRLRLDRLVALRDRVRMAEAAAEGDALRAEAPLPQYAEEAYADALLYTRSPEAARDAYDRALAQNPKSVAARYGRFYASVELEDFDAAYATIDALVADEPKWRTYGDAPSLYPNVDRTYAEATAAQARFYGNQLAEAWARITRIAEAAPADGNTRIALYQIANARGWRQRSIAEAEIAASLAPRDLGARIALVEAAITDYRFAEADRLAKELAAQFPENLAVRRLVRDVDAKRRWVLEAEAMPADSDGGGANASGRSLTARSRLTTPPIADHWRLFAFVDYADARPPEGFVSSTRAGAGVEWRSGDFIATLYPTQSSGTVSKTGGGGTLDWLANDQLRFAVGAERFSRGTPLRALLQDITADEYSASATYRWHEFPQRRGELCLSAVHRRQRPPLRRPRLQGAARQPPRPRRHRLRGGIRVEEHAPERALLQSLARPVADRRRPRRASRVAPLRQRPRPGAHAERRPLLGAGLPGRLDRHPRLRAQVALRSSDRVPLRRDAEPSRLRRLGRERADLRRRARPEILTRCASSSPFSSSSPPRSPPAPSRRGSASSRSPFTT